MTSISTVPRAIRPSLLAALLCVLVLAHPSLHTHADSPITITTAPAVQNHFPDELTFTISAKDSVPITDAVLHYTLLPDGVGVLARGEFDKGTDVQVTYHMRSNGNPLYLPPGREISYSWELTDANGGKLTTGQMKTTFTDTRFQWKTLTAGNLTLNYYHGSDADAQNLLNVGRNAIDKSSQLEGTQVTFPIKLFAYASSQDFLPAAQKESKATDPGLLGEAEGPDIVIFWAPSLRGGVDDTVRHELTHLVTAQAVKGGYEGLLPLWLNEGTSVYAQADPGGFGRAIQQAIDDNSVVPIQVLESSRGIDVGLFYGESWALVRFLVQTGGQPKFAQLLAAIKSGKSIDQALQATYGFDRTGLYNAWRDSVHLSGPGSQRAQGQTSSAPQQPQAAPPSTDNGPRVNATPFTGPAPSRAGTTSDSPPDRGSLVLLLTLGGALLLLLIAAITAMGLVLARRSRGA